MARRLGTRFSYKRTDAIMKKIDTRMEKNDEATLQELRLPSQKEINVVVSI